MSFLKRLFGGGSDSSSNNSGSDGFFVYVQCDRCEKRVRLRINKHHDLNRTDDGFVWRKTIVDSRCFQQIPTVVHFDRSFTIVSEEIDGGHFISQAEYDLAEVSRGTDTDSASD